MKKLFILPLTLALVTICGLIVAGKLSLMIYIEPISLVFIVIVPLLIMLTHFSPLEIIQAFGAAIEGGTKDVKSLKRAELYFKSLQATLISTAVLGIAVAAMAILTRVDDPAHLGRWLAMGLLSIFYSVGLFTFVALPFRSGVSKRLIEQEG